jgi:hypothetical protein
MSQLIPLAAVPSQQFGINLDGQNCVISVYQKTTGLYLDVLFNGAPLSTTVRCLQDAQLLADRQYLGFVGDLVFVDTQGDTDPQYEGLGVRYFLVYLEAADLALQAAALDG